MPELLASLTLFAPEIALTLGLLAVVLADSVGGRLSFNLYCQYT